MISNFLNSKISVFVLLLICVVIVVLPHAFGFILIPKSEDFEYTLIPALYNVFHYNTGFSGNWNWQVGLGSPWPPPIGLSNSPLSGLFKFLPVYQAMAVITAFHLAICIASLILLCKYFGLKFRYSALIAVTYVAGPALETLYNADAYSVYYTSLLFPSILLLTIMTIDAPDILTKSKYAIILGGFAGLMISSGHVGVIPVYIFAIAIYVIARGVNIFKEIPYAIISILIAFYFNRDSILLLYNEASLFAESAPRLQDHLRHGIWGAFSGFLFWPFYGLFPIIPSFEVSAVEYWARSQSIVRNIGVGPFIAFSLFMYHKEIFSDHKARKLLISGAIGLLIMIIPLSVFPESISAIWPMRDFVNLSMAICAIKAVQLIRSDAHKTKIIIGQIFVIIFGAVPLLFLPYIVAERGYYLSGRYSEIADPAVETAYIDILTQGVKDSHLVHPRIAASSRAWSDMDREAGVDMGIINNVAILHGFAEVTFIAKGISFDAIRTSAARPYGTIVGTLIDGWGLRDGSFDWIIDDQPMLTLLGIEVVVAKSNDKPAAPSLIRYGRLQTRDGFEFDFYKNRNVLNRAFFIEEKVLEDISPSRCDMNVLFCFDVSSIVKNVDDSILGAEIINNVLNVSFESSKSDRVMLASYMYRKNVDVKSSDGIDISVVPWAGLMKLLIPSGVSEINISYN